MVTRLDINTDVLSYYVGQSQTPIKRLQDKVSVYNQVISGEKNPTFNQLSDIARIINIPTGLLMLQEPIEIDNDRLSFRTFNSKNLEGVSAELKDTISEMELKQDFLRSEIDYEIEFVGKYTIHDNYMVLADVVRKYLDISKDYYKAVNKNPIQFFRERMNNLGVFVFFNGKIKDDTHRNLDINEFRGFVLSDKKAPIIFVNQKDSKNGQLFTLIHEFIHIFLNIDDIFNVIETDTYQFDPTEAFVNKVTAELLVPESELNMYTNQDIESLSRKFNVSQYVIARRLLDLNYISKNKFTEIIHELEKNYNNIRPLTKSTGGDYNKNLLFRLDQDFFKYVDNALKQNRITYTDAFNILGVGYKGFKTLKKGRR
ncbi:ImmA/IrrE family metallo-endopeptidase [Ruoffia tabacinasalis]|uniref:ImmA/IrrE family metallo-endopeptidase n=1 Tax=Ruoffia tabacinasalis TaxID=87458 RepID=A0A5R9DVT5_9LACT|nr:ImmA/IrrE family metallo-endopeptidase [Ruoffia tabacinasalis]TLQ40934.1 ImmA/IrrE family metallo-endopeptidase [Ruoffia tabacinasalis]